jgi:hypothetical protein
MCNHLTQWQAVGSVRNSCIRLGERRNAEEGIGSLREPLIKLLWEV